MHDYDLLISKIVKISGLDRSEVERRVEDKKKKLSGLISREGAAQIIAAELGIALEDQELKINEIMAGMKKVSVFGKVINLFPVREFERSGNMNKVANLIIADETGSVKLVLWDVNHISLIESGKIKHGDVISVKNGNVRDGEIHLSSFSELKKSQNLIENVRIQVKTESLPLEEVRHGQNVKVRGTVVQIFQPRFYSVCPECKKKAVSEGEKFRCLEHGLILPKERAILNFVLDDGTETMRVVMFSDQINKLVSEDELKNTEKAMGFREEFLGSEIYLSGPVKRNQLFNNLEIIANDVERVDVEQLIEELEVKN